MKPGKFNFVQTMRERSPDELRYGMHFRKGFISMQWKKLKYSKITKFRTNCFDPYLQLDNPNFQQDSTSKIEALKVIYTDLCAGNTNYLLGVFYAKYLLGSQLTNVNDFLKCIETLYICEPPKQFVNRIIQLFIK